jgi:hypothetical protein
MEHVRQYLLSKPEALEDYPFRLDGSMPTSEIERMIDNSYALVVRGLTRVAQQQLGLHYTTAQLFGQRHAASILEAAATDKRRR